MCKKPCKSRLCKKRCKSLLNLNTKIRAAYSPQKKYNLINGMVYLWNFKTIIPEIMWHLSKFSGYVQLEQQ